MRKFDSVVKFSSTNEDSKKLVAMMEDYAKHDLNEKLGTKYSVDAKYSKEEKAKKINEVYLNEISRRSKYSLKDFDGDVYDYANFDSVAKMQAVVNKIMLDTITPIIINATGLSMLAEIHYGGYGDVFEFEMKDDTLYDVSRMGRRQRHTKVQERKKQNKTIGTEFYGLSTIANLPQIILGEAMIAEDMMLMGMSMNKKIYTLVVKKFIEATETIDDPRFIVTNYTEKGLLEKLRTGSAWNGSPMVVLGDAVALKDILPSNTATRIFLQDEYNTTLGYMSTFNTYKVLAFDVVQDEAEESGVLGLPVDKLYGISTGIGGKLIHVAIGTTMTNTDDPMDNDNFSKITTLRKELGVELATNQKVVRCDLAEE